MGAGTPRGIKAARKLKIRRRKQRWADKAYKKSHLGSRWKSNPFRGSSHAKGIVVEKVAIEAKQVGTPKSCCSVIVTECLTWGITLQICLHIFATIINSAKFCLPKISSRTAHQEW